MRTGKNWDVVEKEVLLGQKLTGTLTLARVYELLVRDEKTEEFPFFSIVYKISFEGMDPSMIVKQKEWDPKHYTKTLNNSGMSS